MITASQAEAIAELMRDAEHALDEHRLGADGAGARELLRRDLVDWARDLCTLARHAREVAAVGCRVAGCRTCDPDATTPTNTNATEPTP